MSARDLHGSGPPWQEGFRVIGRARPKIDALAKATGAALYADDLVLPGMLHAKMLRSTQAHARIRSIDCSAARALPGVHAVLTGKDLPVKYGVIPWTPDENALALDKVRFVGDEVAAVAAVDEDTANAALKLIEVEYEPLHAFLEPEDALNRPEPQIHEQTRSRGSSSRSASTSG
jgi:CO/xanthine dehydrogenase Mo-binding subunit